MPDLNDRALNAAIDRLERALRNEPFMVSTDEGWGFYHLDEHDERHFVPEGWEEDEHGPIDPDDGERLYGVRQSAPGYLDVGQWVTAPTRHEAYNLLAEELEEFQAQ